MMQVIFKRIFHFQEMILLLSLTVLACLPIALSNLVRDASLSLLLPTTLIGTLLTWLLATKQNRKSTSITFLLLIGFLLLFIRVGQIGSPIIELLKQTFNLFPKIYSLLPCLSFQPMTLLNKLLPSQADLLFGLPASFKKQELKTPPPAHLLGALVFGWLQFGQVGKFIVTNVCY